jgi:hypothetical protein
MNTIAKLGADKPANTWQPRVLKVAETQMVAGAGRYVGPSGSV